MERELPADAAVLGVDEHTAVLIDLQTEAVEILGRGGVTVRRAGNSIILPSGMTLPWRSAGPRPRVRRATGTEMQRTGRAAAAGSGRLG